MTTLGRPTGLLRLVLRAPVGLYRMRLGWLLGSRFVYIVQRGRRTGMPRAVVVEAVNVKHRPPEITVVAAWGARPDWYLNLRAAPPLEIRCGSRRWIRPGRRFLEDAETGALLAAYQQEHRRVWKRIAPVIGLPSDPLHGDLSDVHAIAFTPGASSTDIVS